MGALGTGPFSKEFDLDKDILPAGSSAKVLVSVTTDPAVLGAILANDPFPAGNIELGNISLQAQAGKNLEFNAGQEKISFSASAGAGAGMGVFTDSAKAISALKLAAPPELDLSLPSGEANRYLVMQWNYSASGSVSLSHPIGAIGSVSATITGKHSGIYGVVHAFPPSTGANTVMKETLTSWRLPRHVGDDADLRLKPRTWLIAEVDGTLAINIAAQLGYDFSFGKDFQFLDQSREISAKIDAGLKATFGFSATSKYIVMVGRESASEAGQKVRLRLFKQSKRETDVGIDLNVGVVTKAEIPANVHDLVKAVFGVHGQQIVKDLELLEKWTDPKKDLGNTVARLINSTGLSLLTKTTGIDAKSEFNRARSTLLEVVQQWNHLPQRVSATLWNLIGSIGPAEVADFKKSLTVLATSTPDQLRVSLEEMIGEAVVADSPIGRILSAMTDRGLSALSSQIPTVQAMAKQTLGFLNSGVIKNLQNFIGDKLDLQKVLDANTQADFDKLDGWVVTKLSDFFDEKLQFSNLRPIQTAIHSALAKADQIYDKIHNAANHTFKFQFAAAFSSSSTNKALLDVDFDLLQPGVHEVLKSVLADGNFDPLLTKQIAGITLNDATLSHQISRTTTADVHMPMFDFQSKHVTDSIAKLTARDEGGRVLLYELDAKNTVLVKARYHSQLSALANLRVDANTLQLSVTDDSVISYEDRQARRSASFAELRHRTDGFAATYLASAVGADLDAFYARLQAGVEAALATAEGTLGDALLAMELSYPASILNAWFLDRTDADLMDVSRILSCNIQTVFRDLLCSYYFRDSSRFGNLGASTPLLTWASLPLATSVALGNDGVHIHRDSGLYWDFQTRDIRRGMLADGHTTANLRARLRAVQDLLNACGDSHSADRYDPGEAENFQRTAANAGDNNVFFLLRAESNVVSGAVNALHDIHNALPQLKLEPSKAIRRLAEFGADLTEAFNDKIASIYGDDSLRTLGTVLLIEASKVLDPATAAPTPEAMLSIALLKPGHKFDTGTFVDGQTPNTIDIGFSKAIPALRPKAVVVGE